MATHHEHHDDHHEVNLEEKFEFSAGVKKKIFTLLVIGIISFVIGLFLVMNGGGSHGSHGELNNTNDALASLTGGETANGGHGEYKWTTRLFANLWINNIFFSGLALLGVFFVAIQYVATAGWSAGIKRIPEAFGQFLPFGALLTIGVFLVANHDLFHWTHHDLYDPNSPMFDPIINGKKGYLNMGFYVGRMVTYFVVWYAFYYFLRQNSLQEDVNGGIAYFRKMQRISAAFIVFFGVSSSMAAWDWVMSIDTHWFSTMFGWYVFASWWVSALALITLFVIYLKDAGYLSFVGESHLHDLGKFVFAFSIFWTYIWFSQFLLIYYANIPEETIYFVDRLRSDHYSKFIFANLFLNFFFPFLGLMTRDAKRKMTILKIVCFVVLIGHWSDFYLMIMPGTLKENGGLHFLELGTMMIYLSLFLFIVLNALSKAPLVAKNHPMIEESVHHHI
ncbi:MAG: hypothetical protein OHK0038_03790 [Flammeovirgaceae bacterium]